MKELDEIRELITPQNKLVESITTVKKQLADLEARVVELERNSQSDKIDRCDFCENTRSVLVTGDWYCKECFNKLQKSSGY